MMCLALGAVAISAAAPAVAQPPAAAAPQTLSPPDRFATSGGELVIQPVNHASFYMTYKGKVIYVDPVGGVERYLDFPKPDVIILTDIHGDHLSAPSLGALVGPNTPIIAPASVRATLPPNLQARVILLQNGQSTAWEGVGVEAVAMYNTTPDRTQLHTKGRGNGYVLTFGDKRVYIAGDTEPTPEMAALRNIDVAFLPMNQPFTMTPQQAADAVKTFKPKVVYPYHSRGTDVGEFARLVGSAAEVRQRSWY